jgi:hypothetical protein
MAEAVGLLLGAIVLVKPVVTTIHTICSDASNYGADASALFLRFTVCSTRLSSLERILLDVGKFPSVPGRLFDQFPPNLQQLIIQMLQRLYGQLYSFASTKERYGNGKEETWDPAIISEGDLAALVGLGQAEDRAMAKGTSRRRKAMWVLVDKKSTEKMVVTFEEWTERFRLLIESAWWPLPTFSLPSQLEGLKLDKDTADAGLLPDLELRKLLMDDSASADVAVHLKLALGQLQKRSKAGDSHLDLGILKGNTVAVEYLEYAQDDRTKYIKEPVLRRIQQLSALLHQQKDERFKVPRCIGYFDDIAPTRIGLVFELSPHVTTAESLYNLYGAKTRPSLDSRLKLAHQLAESLMLLHSVGWVHKSLRSSKIMFFRTDKELRENPGVNLQSPKVLGFEYARMDSDATSLTPDHEQDLYRHPERWGETKERFTMVHDIYGENIAIA